MLIKVSTEVSVATIDNIAGVTQADVDEVRRVLNTEYGFDPGGFAASDVDEDEKVLIKIDWNINDDHRAVASYQVADGDVLFDDFPETAVLQSNRYNINQKLNNLNIILKKQMWQCYLIYLIFMKKKPED